VVVSRYTKTSTEMEDQRISDILRTFISLEMREQARQRLNETLPRVLQMVDAERAAGRAIDLPMLVRRVYFETGPEGLIE
jgi:GTP cyclohydrolase I